MRTTIRLDDQLLKTAKQYAYEQGKSLTAVIEGALRHSLSRAATAPKRLSVKLTTVKGNGLYPGIDLGYSSSLLSVMEEPLEFQKDFSAIAARNLSRRM